MSNSLATKAAWARMSRPPFCRTCPDSPLTLPPDKAIAWYDTHAERIASQYETLAAGDVHAWLTDLLPAAPGLILDVGAGSGQDAAWLAARSHEVLAVEPSSSMRQQGQQLHGDTRIRWLEDRRDYQEFRMGPR